MLVLQSSTVDPSEYEFDEFRVDVMQRALFRNESSVLIPSKVFSLLLVFMRHPRVEVKKEDLMQDLWPNAYVEPCNLTQSVFLLRRALGQASNGQRYIVTVPGQGYLFACNVKAVSTPSPSGSPFFASGPQSLAVIPFRMLNAPGDMQYLGTGLADALTNRFSHIRELRVRPLGIANRLLEAELDTLSLGRELAVDLLLTGNVQVDYRRPQSVSRVRVSVQLTCVKLGAILWSDTIEHELCHLLPLQDMLAETIGDLLSDKLSAQEHERLTRRRTRHPEAPSSGGSHCYSQQSISEIGFIKGR